MELAEGAKKISQEKSKENSIDFDILFNEDISQYSKEEKDKAKEYQDMIKDVDSYMHRVKRENDQLKNLVEKVKDTKTKVNSHMNGGKNLAEQAGVKKKVDPLTSNVKGINRAVVEDEDEEENLYDEYGNYKKEENVEKLASNLFKIQGNVIDYHQNFSKDIHRAEENNSMIRKFLGTLSGFTDDNANNFNSVSGSMISVNKSNISKLGNSSKLGSKVFSNKNIPNVSVEIVGCQNYRNYSYWRNKIFKRDEGI